MRIRNPGFFTNDPYLCAGVIADYETLGRQPPPVRGSLSRDYETVRSSIGTTTLSFSLHCRRTRSFLRSFIFAQHMVVKGFRLLTGLLSNLI
jgi:hypothetical protein